MFGVANNDYYVSNVTLTTIGGSVLSSCIFILIRSERSDLLLERTPLVGGGLHRFEVAAFHELVEIEQGRAAPQ